MGKAAIINPYLDTLGGGEKYTLSFAKVLSENGYDVDIEWKDKSILNVLTNRFGMKLQKNINIVNDAKRGENYDLCFWVSDGSIPTLRSSKNFIHFQVPFTNVNGKSLLNRMKLFRVTKIICNSDFTKNIIDNEYGVNSDVLYPPIDINSFKIKRKENIILYVGRFSSLLQVKGQDVLINSFKKFYDQGRSDWKLVLAGGVEVGSDKNMENLEKMIGKYPIEIVKSPSFDYLKDIFGKAKIFWSAAGNGVDETINPENVEHFGITLLEGMSAGVVPFAYNAGGHKEIIDNGINGYLWQNETELVKLTEQVITSKGSLSSLSKQAILKSKKYEYENFKEKVLQIIK